MKLFSKFLAATVAAVTVAGAGHAATVSPVAPLPVSLDEGASESANAQLFAERSSVTVGANEVVVDFVASDLTYGVANSGVNNFSSGSFLAAGTYDSFLIHFDPDGADSTTGMFGFANDIVAIILSNGDTANGNSDPAGLLNVSDSIFGGALYDTRVGRRSETNDSFTLESATELSFALATSGNFVDNIRVITKVSAVPLPAGGLLLLTGFGFLAAYRRRAS